MKVSFYFYGSDLGESLNGQGKGGALFCMPGLVTGTKRLRGCLSSPTSYKNRGGTNTPWFTDQEPEWPSGPAGIQPRHSRFQGPRPCSPPTVLHNPQGRLGEETSGVDMELKSSYLLGSEEGTWLLW